MSEHKVSHAQLHSVEALEQALWELESVYETAPVGLCLFDAGMRYRRVNRRLAEMNGVSMEAHIGKTVREIVPHLADAVEPLLRRVLETGEPVLNFELEGETAARPGVTRWWRENWYPLRAGDGTVTGINVTAVEVTELKQAERSLLEAKEQAESRSRELERLYREREYEHEATIATIESIADGFMTLDRSWSVTYINKNGARIVGKTPDEMISRRVWELFPDSAKTGASNPFFRTPQTNVPIQFEGYYPAPLEMWYECHVYPRPDGLSVLFRNITERKHAEEALQASAEKFRVMGETIPYGVWWCNDRGEPEYVSTSFLELTESSMEGLHDGGLKSRLTKDEYRTLVSSWRRCTATGEDLNCELHILGPDRVRHTVLTRGKPIRNTAGSIVGWVGINLDIEDLERLERDLLTAKEEAERANRAKSEFLAHMSHEIRTPISGIIGMTDILLSRITNQEQCEYLSLVRESAESLLTIVSDILDLTRIESGVEVLELSPWELRKELNAVIMPFATVARAKNLSFSLAIDPALPKLLQADSGKIGQILRNLVSNAIKYTERGGVRVSVSRVESRGTRDTIRFAVTDTGVGIEPDRQEAIFESFVRLRKSVTERNVEGSGLGLTITRRLVELMDGSIALESTPGTGSTFEVTLELARCERRQKATVPGRTLQMADLPPLEILVVEDNRINQMFLELSLQEAGHSVRTANHGGEALEMLENADGRPYDIVLMDVQMPVVDGIEATRRIRALPGPAARIPIIALTAFAMQSDRERFMKAGMNGYVTKPVDWEELSRVILSLRGR